MIRDHERARLAHTHAKSIVGSAAEGAYAAHCHKLPILVHQGGLAAALHHTVALRKVAKAQLVDHLAAQLHAAELIDGATRESLLAAVREADLSETWQLTREVQRCLDWYRRFAHSVLGVETSGDEAGDP